MSNISRRQDQGLGKTAAGGSGGSFAAYERDAASPPAIGHRLISIPESEKEAAAARLAERYPQVAEAQQLKRGTFPRGAADSAARWLAWGESEESALQLFDHERLHNRYVNLGSVPKRRKCTKCRGEVEAGTGTKAYWAPQNKTVALCDSCSSKTEFRPPAPEATVERFEPIYGDPQTARMIDELPEDQLQRCTEAFEAETRQHYARGELTEEETTRGFPEYEERLEAWVRREAEEGELP